MLNLNKQTIIVFLIFYILCFPLIIVAQNQVNDNQIIKRYKTILHQKPKEGIAFEKVYLHYLENAGLDAMVNYYKKETQTKPDDPSGYLILGHIYKRLGKETDAIAAYQHAIETTPNDYYPHFALGQLYFTLRENNQAISQLTQAISRLEQIQTTTPEELIRIYKLIGHVYFRQDKVNEAIQVWEKIATLNPQNILARIELADLYHEQKLYTHAITQHQKVIEIKKDDPYRVCLSYREIGNLQVQNGDTQNAIQSYDTALAMTTTGNWLRKDLQSRIIAIYANDANWKDLILYYQEKLNNTPNDQEIYGLLAAAYIENQQFEEGITAYRKGLQLAPTDTNLRLNLINALRNADRSEEAVTEYETLIKHQPGNIGSYLALGKLYVDLDNEEKAKTIYQKMIDYDPKNASTYITLAETYAKHKWTDEAVSAFENAISLDPDNMDYIEYFGEFYYRQGNRNKAILMWSELVEDNKGTAENYDNLARLLSSKEFHTESINASRKAVELSPDVYRYREALANRLMDSKAYDQALAEYTEAAKLVPNEFFAEEIHNKRIEIYRRQGTLMKTIELMEMELQKTDLTPTKTFTTQKRLAKMYLKLGNITHALKVLINAKMLYPNDIVINRWLADIYTKQGRREDAIIIYKHLINVDKPNARDYYAKMSHAYIDAMNFEDATDAAKQVVAHAPRNPEGHQLLAQIYKLSRNYQASIDSLKQAVRLRPDDINIRKVLAETFILSGKPQESIAQYWRSWELSNSVSEKLDMILPLMGIYYDLGRRNEFIDKLKHMEKTHKSDVDAVLGLAELYRIEGNLTNVRFQLALALDRERNNPELLESLVETCLDLGDIKGALAYQQQLVETHPDPVNYQKLGELLFDSNRQEEAIQVWDKLLHTRNGTFEAEFKLSTFLFQHGLVDKALSVLDRAADKAIDAISIFQLGSAYVAMHELDRAKMYLQQTLEIPKPFPTQSQLTYRPVESSTYTKPSQVGININKFNLTRDLYWQIVDGTLYLYTGRPIWKPKSFEEAQVGAIVLLMQIAYLQNTLPELIQQLETNARKNPKDIRTLETLVYFYIAKEDSVKANKVIERLITAEPDNPTYHAIRMNNAIENYKDSDTIAEYINDIHNLPTEIQVWFIVKYAGKLSDEGRTADAKKLVENLKNEKVTDLKTGAILIKTLTQINAVEEAQKILDQLPVPPGLPKILKQISWSKSSIEQQWQLYLDSYQNLTTAYIELGHIDKAIELFWKYHEYSKPSLTTSQNISTLGITQYTYRRYNQIQSYFTSPTMYFSQNRMKYLQHIFSRLWMKNERESLYAYFHTKLKTTKGKDRIYPALAMSYCHWWEGNREKAREGLYTLQNEYPNDLTLKLNTVFLSIQMHQYVKAIELLDECAESDLINKEHYYALMLELALHSGNTATVRNLMMKKLNSGSSARELHNFSRQLQSAGLTQYAIAVAQRATNLVKQEKNPTYLIEFAQYLIDLGRNQDAALLANRALLFANRTDLQQRAFEQTYEFRRAANIAKRPDILNNRKKILIQAAQNNPKSFKAQVELARFYSRTDQHIKSSDAYKKALSLKPEDDTTRLQYAYKLYEGGQYGKATNQYAILLKNNPNVLGTNYWQVINTYSEAEKLNELVTIVIEMLDTDEDRSHNKNHIGLSIAQQIADRYAERVRYNTGLVKPFIQISEKIIEYDPSNIEIFLKLVSVYVQSNEHNKAIELIRQKLSTTNDIAIKEPLIIKLVEIYKNTGNLEELVKEYKEQLDKNPSDMFLCYLVAYMKINMNDIEAALPLIHQVNENFSTPIHIEWIQKLANTCQAAEKYDLGTILLKTVASQSNPYDMRTVQNNYEAIAIAYYRNGEIEKAQDIYRKLGNIQLMQSGDNINDKERIAKKYMSFKMWDDAEVLFKDIRDNKSGHSWYQQKAQEELKKIQKEREKSSATVQEPEKIDIGSLRVLARQYMNSNRSYDAIKAYEQIIKVMPEDLVSKSNLATLYSRHNQHSKAVTIWNELIEIDPTNTKYQDGLVLSYQTIGKFSKALELAQQYIDAEPEIGSHYTRIAKLYADKNQIDESITAYEKSISLAPGNQEVYRGLLDLYLLKNDIDAVEETYEQAIQYISTEDNRQAFERLLLNLYAEHGKLDIFLKRKENEGELTFLMQRAAARRYQNTGELEKAIIAYKKAYGMTVRDNERKDIATELQRIYTELNRIADQLIMAMSHRPKLFLNVTLSMCEFYRENDIPEQAKTYIRKAGFIPDDAWLVLGPFDNNHGNGYETVFIPEDTTQHDTNEEYNSKNGNVEWEINKDNSFDGFIDLGTNDNWLTTYALITINSPDERNAQIRIGSDQPTKTWLNGKEIFANTELHLAKIDQHIIPVSLKQKENVILVKVCTQEKSGGFYLRITDINGIPFKDLEFLNPEEGTQNNIFYRKTKL